MALSPQKITNYINFMVGFVSLFIIPEYKNVRLLNLSVVLSCLILLMLFLITKKYRITFKEFTLAVGTFLFFLSTLWGAINSGIYIGFASSFIFITSFLFAFLSFKISKEEALYYSLKGLIYSSIITSVWNILQFFYYYATLKPLNKVVFPEFLLPEEAIYLHFLYLDDKPAIYRSSGFSWDPGLVVPYLVISTILISEEIIKVRFKKFFLMLFFIGISISFSKTSIVGLSMYFILKSLRRLLFTYPIMLATPFVLIFLLFLLGFAISPTTSMMSPSNIRHIKYFSEIINIINAPINEIMFGYGFRGGGYFYNNYISWLKDMGVTFEPGSHQESTLPSFLLWGGTIGLIYWFFVYCILYFQSNQKTKLLLLTLIFLFFGYYISSPMLYIIIFGIALININKYQYKNLKLCAV